MTGIHKEPERRYEMHLVTPYYSQWNREERQAQPKSDLLSMLLWES